MLKDYGEVLPKWVVWIKQICSELTTLDYHDKLVTELNKIISENPALMEENPLSEWMSWVHASDVALRIRRQVDGDNNAMSLRRLLEKLQPYANDLVRNRVEIRPEGVSEQSMRFAVCGEGRHTLDVSADIIALIDRTKCIVCYADRVVAHADRRGMPAPPTWPEVHAAAEFIVSCAERYYLLLTGNSNRIRLQGPLSIRRFFLQPWIVTAHDNGPTIHSTDNLSVVDKT